MSCESQEGLVKPLGASQHSPAQSLVCRGHTANIPWCLPLTPWSFEDKSKPKACECLWLIEKSAHFHGSIHVLEYFKLSVVWHIVAGGTSAIKNNVLTTDCETLEQVTNEEVEAPLCRTFLQGKRLILSVRCYHCWDGKVVFVWCVCCSQVFALFYSF